MLLSPAQAVSPACAAASPPRRLRVLVVEDSPDDYELVLTALRRGGYVPVAQRVDNETAMAAALAVDGWDVVLCDHRLPRFSSRQALITLKRSHRNVPFLIVSGAIGEDAAAEAMHAGADDYVLKDRLVRLVPAIQRSLDAAEARREHRLAERALRESEARFRAIASNIPGMVFQMHYEPAGGAPFFTYASGGASEIFGIAAEEFLASGELLFELLADGGTETLRAALETAARDAAAMRWEGAGIYRGAARRWLQVSASPRVVDGTTVWDGLVTDVTPLKAAQEELETSREELRALTAHLEQAKERERARIAREIHDDIGGTLTGLKADLTWLRRRLGSDGAVAEKLSDMGMLLDATMATSVRIARDLRPPILDFGFLAALQWQAQDFQRRIGTSCRFNTDATELDLDSTRATAVFRIFQELLTNIAKHAHAEAVEVQVAIAHAELRIDVIDNGVGFEHADLRKPGSYGVRGMSERARELGGQLTLARRAPRGTHAALRVPLQDHEEVSWSAS